MIWSKKRNICMDESLIIRFNYKIGWISISCQIICYQIHIINKHYIINTLKFWSNKKVYQSEGSQHRKTFHIGQAQLHQTQAHNEAIEYIPALLEVVVWVHCNQFGKHFGSEDTSKHLQRKKLNLGGLLTKRLLWDLFNLILLISHTRLIYKSNLISTNLSKGTYPLHTSSFLTLHDT